MAEIYFKDGIEHTLILGVREAFIQGFEATDWTDIRIGFFLSITEGTNDDLITGLQEDIGVTRDLLAFTDRVAIGLTSSVSGGFCGYTNSPSGRVSPGVGSSRLLSSDLGIGTSNANYWRATNGVSNNWSAQIIQNDITRAGTNAGSQPHMVQAYGPGATGYASLWALRFTRPDTRGRAKIITMQVPKAITNANAADLLFGSDPSNAILESELEDFPTTVQSLGPVELLNAPDTFFLYWPFRGSRLRIHSMGLLKAS